MDFSRSFSDEEEQEYREAYERKEAQARIDADECELHGDLIGRLSELPIWAQTYIRHLRKQITS